MIKSLHRSHWRLLPTLVLVLASTGSVARAESPTFEKNVLPILTGNCLSCHGGLKQKGGLDLRTAASVLKGGESGAAVTPENPQQSLLWQKVAADQMPKGPTSKLSADDKKIIQAWIVAGARSARPTDPATAELPASKRTPTVVAAEIDQLIDGRLLAEKIPPSPPASDAEFLRRAYLDIIGRIPTAEQAATFLDNNGPDKRSKLIDELLARPEYGQHFSTIWHNLLVPLQDGKRVLRPPFRAWLARSFNENNSWERMVFDLLTAEGDEDTAPPVGYFLAQPAADKQSFTTARLFLGIHLECAECHNHPLKLWKQTDYWGMAAFFTATSSRMTGKGKDQKATVTEAVRSKQLPAITIPKTALTAVGSKVPASFLDARTPMPDEQGKGRHLLAAWLTAADNPWFARASVNRLWAHFFGTGFVNPLDDLDAQNLPSHPELLARLTHEFRVSGHDLKHLIRCICTSKTYQRSSRILVKNQDDNGCFSRPLVKVLTPEMLYDSLTVALEVPELTLPKPFVARNDRVPDWFYEPRNIFANYFTYRDGAVSTDFDQGIPQLLRLMNMEQFNNGGKIVERLANARDEPDKVVESLFLATLSRRPQAEEGRLMAELLKGRDDRQQAYRDILWILLNSSAFSLNR